MPPKENRSSLREPLNPPEAAGCFIKSASPDFMKNKFLCVLRASVVNTFLKYVSFKKLN
jgi:hypothetical protein